MPGFDLESSELKTPESPIDTARIEKAMREIIEAIGENPDREGLVDTPGRVARFYSEVFSGVHEDPGDQVDAFFGDEHYQEIVMVREIPFYSMCEHHFAPFHGQAHVAYMPKGRVTGLSKLARLVDGYARRPQMQERLTAQVADCLADRLDPLGVLVVIEAEHMCMSMRGVKKPGSKDSHFSGEGSHAERPVDPSRSDVFALRDRLTRPGFLDSRTTGAALSLPTSMGRMVAGLKPRGFTWVINDKLAVSDRVGGSGFQHRRVRREEEITWLVEEAEINTIVSMLPGNQNLAAYRQAGIATYSVPLTNPVEQRDVVRFFNTLDQALARNHARVLIHRETIDDTIGGLLGGYLVDSGMVDNPILALAIIQQILGRALGPEGRSLIPEANAS